jgi:hypothetical protein
MPRFRIVSEDGRAAKVIDTVTGQVLKATRIELVADIHEMRVVLELIGDDFALDIAAGDMMGGEAASEAEPDIDEAPKKRQTLS